MNKKLSLNFNINFYFTLSLQLIIKLETIKDLH